MPGGALEIGVDAGHRIRERPLARCHTLDSAEGPRDPTPPGGLPLATEATPTLPSQTPSHACLLSAIQSHEPGEHCLRPLGDRGSRSRFNSDSGPRFPAGPTDGGQTPGRRS